jgi:hypothetical protein
MNKTFKELNDMSSVEKCVKKAGLSLAIIFSKDDCAKYNIQYGDIVRLDTALIIKPVQSKSI